jgi:hypothetical protein
MNLEKYLRWRLEPGEQRAEHTRQMLRRLVLQPLLSEDLVDWTQTVLPPEVALTRLRLGKDGGVVGLFALIRNGQSNLHELGFEATGLLSIQEPQPFKLVFREKQWIANVLSDREACFTDRVEGMLDPISPSIFSLRVAQPGVLKLEVPNVIELGQTITFSVTPQEKSDQAPRVYGMWVKDGSGVERFHYRKVKYAEQGSWTSSVPVALSDSCGTWTLLIREATSGTELNASIKIEPARD